MLRCDPNFDCRRSDTTIRLPANCDRTADTIPLRAVSADSVGTIFCALCALSRLRTRHTLPGHTQSASWMSSTDLMKCVWPRMKLMDSGFAIWTAVNLGSIAIANLLHLGVRSSRLRVSCQSVQGSRPTPEKAHVCCLPCCRQKTVTRPAQKSFLHKVLRLPKAVPGLRCLPREVKPFTLSPR